MPKRTPPKKRQSDFCLPSGVSMQKELLPSGWAYIFRHAELGVTSTIRWQIFRHILAVTSTSFLAVSHYAWRRFHP